MTSLTITFFPEEGEESQFFHQIMLFLHHTRMSATIEVHPGREAVTTWSGLAPKFTW